MVSTLVSIYFGAPQLGHQIKTNCLNVYTVDPEKWNDQFWFFGKGSRTSSFTTFYAWFFKKNVFHVIFYRPNFIFWLPLLFEILGNICFVIICFQVCDVINFEINLSFLMKLSFYLTKKVRTKIQICYEQKELLR